MSKKLFSSLLFIAMFGLIISCNSTKTTTNEVVKKVEKPKKDNNVYDLMGNSLASAQNGIRISKKYESKLGTVTIGFDGGQPQVGTITYYFIEEENEETFGSNSISKKYIKNDFSLDFMLNGNRELSHEYGPLNEVEVTYSPNSEGTWKVNKIENYSESLKMNLEVEEMLLDNYQTKETVRLNKDFYPSSAKTGDSWTLTNDQLRWFFNELAAQYNASGTMTLKEVITEGEGEDEESIAIIDLNLSIHYVSLTNDEQPPLIKDLSFKGQVKRSLTDFIDKEIKLDGSYNIKRVKPAQGELPELDIDIQSTGTYIISEELLVKK